MTSFAMVLIGSYSIALAAIIGLCRLQKIHWTYKPFVFITVVALLNEVASHILIAQHRSNAISVNLFSLLELLLWMWQFKRWNAFDQSKNRFALLLIFLLSIWITENILLQKITVFSSWFAITYSFCMVFLSINQVNRQIVAENRNLLRNPKFLICSGTIIFYTYRILVECFYLLQMEDSNAFLTNIFSILVFVNLFVNLLFALAVVWIPKRQRFSLPSS